MISIRQRRARKRKYMRRKRLDTQWRELELFRQRERYRLYGRYHICTPEYRFQRKCREAGIKMTVKEAREFLNVN